MSSKAAAGKGRKSSSSSKRASLLPPTTPTTLSSWHQAGTLYAELSSVLSRHHLDVHALTADNSNIVASLDVRATPTAVCWVEVSSTTSTPSKKRRPSSANTATTPLVAIALTNGQVDLFSPTHSRVVRILQLGPSADVTTQSVTALSSHGHELWATTATGQLVSWQLDTASSAETPLEPTSTSTPDKSNPVRSLAVTDDHILTANHVIHIHSPTSSTVQQRYSGHSTPVSHLVWLPEHRFISAAQDSRVAYLWSIDTATPIATLSLDSPAVAISVADSLFSVVCTSGSHAIYSVPASLTQSKGAPTALQPISRLLILPRSNAPHSEAYRQLDVGLTGAPSQGAIVARVVRSALKRAAGSAVIIDTVTIRSSPSANISSPLIVVRAPSAAPTTTPGAAQPQRYADPASRSAHRSGAFDGAQVGEDGEVLLGASLAASNAAGLRDVDDAVFDAAEPTLAHRLESLRVQKGKSTKKANGAAEDDEVEHSSSSSDSDEDPAETVPGGPATLSATLLQALQSNDASLLSSILSRGDAALVRATVARLPSQAAPILLEACVQRLAMGSSGRRGRGGTLGSRQAKACAVWIRATLVRHAGFLMALPALVTRLSNLHRTLSSRLASHERLLALQGRMELVLGQIEMRQDYVALQLGQGGKATRVQGVKTKGRGRMAEVSGANGEGKRWVEGSDDEMDVDGAADAAEDDEESEEEADDVEIASEDDDSVDEIGLGGEELDSDSEEDAVGASKAGAGKAAVKGNGVTKGGNGMDVSEDDEDEEDEEDEDDSDDVDDDESDDEDGDDDENEFLDLEAEEGSEEDESEGESD